MFIAHTLKAETAIKTPTNTCPSAYPKAVECEDDGQHEECSIGIR